MNCPICNHKTGVYTTKANETTVKRYRECKECLTQFHTYEKIDWTTVPEYLKGRIYENQV